MRLFLALLALGVLSVPADARDRDRRDRDRDRHEERHTPPAICKAIISERGDRSASESGATENAKKAWIIAAAKAHGTAHAKIENAWTDPDSKVNNPNCFSDPERFLKKWECTYAAAPCLR